MTTPTDQKPVFSLKRFRYWLARLLVPDAEVQVLLTADNPAAGMVAGRLDKTSQDLQRVVSSLNEMAAQQSKGAAEQTDLIVHTNALLDNFHNLSEQIREQGRAITLLAKQNAEVAQHGQEAIQQAIQGMREIRSQVSDIAETIVKLAKLTQRIDEIITSVTEIATQSNLLALNASIEAARAGTQGRGFAVVADEVRSLSQQSTQAAQQVRTILVEIQGAMKETVQATKIGLDDVDAGVAMTQQVDAIMAQLAESVVKSHQTVDTIYAAIRQQAEDLEQITVSMERIDRINWQNMMSIRMAETVAQNLARLATELQNGSAEVHQNADDDSEENAGNPQDNAHENSAAE